MEKPKAIEQKRVPECGMGPLAQLVRDSEVNAKDGRPDVRERK
jgi:hypothetical protein